MFLMFSQLLAEKTLKSFQILSIVSNVATILFL